MSDLCLYSETRLACDPTSNSPTIHLDLPSTSTFSRTSRAISRVVDSTPIAKSEQEFKKTNIADSGSIFFRSRLSSPDSRYPRAISWRCIDARTAIELRSVDISKSSAIQKEATYAIRIIFPNVIQGNGIALSDCVEDNSFNIFVATRNHELYTLSIKSSLFSSRPASTDGGDRWFKIARPGVLNAGTFHRLFALSSLVLLVASVDGRLTRLSRKQGEDGSGWTETCYDEGTWNTSFKSLLPWQSKETLRFEGNSLSQRTVHAAAVSPDHQHVLTVSLDHYLRAWSVADKKVACSRDLLNYPRVEEVGTRYTIDPRTPTNLQIFECRSIGGSRYGAMTFSPYESGLFKFWIVNDADAEEGITDAFEETNLRLPDPSDGALWTFSDFAIQASADTSELEIWILLRLNRRYKLYRRRFEEFASVRQDWSRGWTTTLVEAPKYDSVLQPPSGVELSHEDVLSQWLEFIRHPNQVPSKVLETAFAMYMQGRVTKSTRAEQSSLAERIASVIGSQVQTPSSNSDLATGSEKFELNLETEWTHFWNLVKDLDHLRWEPLSLSLDSQSMMPWLSFTDGIAPIRQCSNFEIVAHNRSAALKNGIHEGLQPSVESNDKSSTSAELEHQALLAEASVLLHSSLSADTRALCESMLMEELWLDPLGTPIARMHSFAQLSGLVEDIGERQRAELIHAVDQKKGLNVITTSWFLSIVDQLSSALARNSGQVSTELGIRAIVRGAQDMVTLHLRILKDLIHLIVYLEAGVNRITFPMKHLDTETVFVALLEQLRVAQLAHWLGTNTRPGIELHDKSEDSVRHAHNSTVLEDLFARDIKPQDEGVHSQSVTLTTSIRDLLVWCAGGNEIGIDKALVSILCDLLKKGNISLANSFNGFLPRTPWSIYIQGRLALACNRYTKAAEHFKEAAFGLSRSKPPASEYHLSSSSLLDPVAASHLASGLPNYYSHIVSLFGSAEAPCHAFVTDFAQLALVHAPSPEQRADLLARLFHSAVALSQFEKAYAALLRLEDRSLQRTAVREMVSAMVAKGAIRRLLALAFPPNLSEEVTKLLVEKARGEGQSLTSTGNHDVPWFKVLYAWRVGQGDLREAAAILVERLEGSGKRRKGAGLLSSASKTNATKLDEYLVSINALALATEDDGEEGWVFVEKDGSRRKVVRLKDLREAYSGEMDRVDILEMGRFGIVGGDEEEGNDEEDMVMEGS